MKRHFLVAFLLVVSSSVFAQTDFKNSQDRLFLKLGFRYPRQTAASAEFYLKRHQSLNASVSWVKKNGEESCLLTTRNYQDYREAHLNVGYRFYAIAKKRGIFRVFIEPGACLIRQGGGVYTQTFLQSGNQEHFNSNLFGVYAVPGFQLNFKYAVLEASLGFAKMLNEKINPIYGEIWAWANLHLLIKF